LSAASLPARSAAVLLLGNELLSGKIQDENLLVLAQLFRRLGVHLQRVAMLPDDRDVIAHEVAALAATHDILVTSGGVGPTHDDVTVDAIAQAFAVEVVTDPAMETLLRDHYRERLNEGHLRMARVPQGAELRSLASVSWPVMVMRNVWILPGVPEIFRNKLRVLEAVLGADTPFLSRAVYTQLDEATLKPWLDATVAEFPAVEIGSYPTWNNPAYRTKITFDSRESLSLDEALQALLRRFPPGEPQRVA